MQSGKVYLVLGKLYLAQMSKDRIRSKRKLKAQVK